VLDHGDLGPNLLAPFPDIGKGARGEVLSATKINVEV